MLSIARSFNFLPIVIMLFLSACGGGGGGNDSQSPDGANTGTGGNGTNSNSNGGGTNGNNNGSPPANYVIGGSVSGLVGQLILQNNGSDTLTIAQSGQFTFSTPLPNGAAYSINILSQPQTQICTVTSSNGSIASGSVTNISVNCVAKSYSVGGTISGLTGQLILQNNGGDTLNISQSGQFTFSNPVPSGVSYSVNILSQPQTQTCTVTSGNGTVASNSITDISVNCVTTSYSVGGTISGLAGPIELQNGSDRLTVSSNGTFKFLTPLATGTTYSVDIYSQPNHRCVVASGSGIVAAENITTVNVTCSAKSTRYQAQSYSSFISSHGTGNLEGTWILLSEGTLTHFLQIAGINPREDYQLWSRSIVRIRKDPNDSSRYFIFSCGPAGGRNTTTSTSNIYIPFFYGGTSNWISYGVNIIDATTLQRSSVHRNLAYTASSSSMGWDFSWTLKRVSDDPFAAHSTITNKLTNQITDVSCIYEAEGIYVATNNDGTTVTTKGKGLFYQTHAYPTYASQLYDDANSYLPSFALTDLAGYSTTYTNNYTTYYRTGDGDSIAVVRSYIGTASTHEVNALNAGTSANAYDMIDISL